MYLDMPHVADWGEDVPESELYGADDPIVAVYADGGCFGSSRSTVGGVWAWCHVNAKGIALVEKSGLLLPTPAWPDITNNYAEYVAAVRALEALPLNAIVHVYLDSHITIGRLVNGWAHNGIPMQLRRRGERAMARLGGSFWHLLDGHPTEDELRTGTGKRGNPVSRHNVWCHNECNREKERYLAKLVEING